MNSQKTIAFIPARGGSQSIPLKNAKLMLSRPLLYWVLDAAVQCQEIDTVFVSTDSSHIRQIVKEYGSSKVKVVDRSASVSTDTASTESTMLEFAATHSFDNIVLVQATSPLLQASDLQKGLQKFFEDTNSSVLSVVRQKRFLWEEKGGCVTAVNYNPSERPRRQDFKGYLVENGAFYITSKKNLLASKCRISGTIQAVEMPEESYYEIDEPSDWVIVEELLRKRTIQLDSLTTLLQGIKCVLTDNDGVLTDSGMYYADNGSELKKFNTKDGMGFQLLREAGIITGIITGEKSSLVKRRAEKLKVDELHMGIKNKKEVLDRICSKHNLQYKEVAYIGDDINDIEVLQCVGLGCSVSDAMDIVKQNARIVTKAKGGEGAFREIVSLLLHAKQGRR